MKRSLLLLTIVLSSLSFIKCTSEKKAINKELTQTASDINESTPVMLDQYTRFDFASVSTDNVFRYHYTIINSENPDSLIRAVESSVRDNISHEFNENPQLRFFKENNVSIEYVYNDETEKTIKIIRIDSSDYH